jgi:hypothetical protein
MLILAPDPAAVSDDAWLRELVGWGGALIAGNVARAWRTAWLLHDAGHVCYGEERRLIEAADSHDAVPTPAPLGEGDVLAEADALRRRNLARGTQVRALRAETGYVSDGSVPADDETVETRIDDVDSVEVFLIEDATGFRAFGEDWSDGRIRIPRRRFGDHGIGQAKDIAITARLPRGTLAIPVRHDWAHDGTVVDRFVIDSRWGLRWV